MRFAVETWAPEYGSATESLDLDDAAPPVDVEVERAAGEWTPIRPRPQAAPDRISFVDGVRRIDARIWITEGSASIAGICASYAAGVVLVEVGQARVVDVHVGRGLFTTARTAEPIDTAHSGYGVHLSLDGSPEALSLALQKRMGDVEAGMAAGVDAELVIVDGPLHEPLRQEGTVGYVKTHRRNYLPEEMMAVVGRLDPGVRTPLFLIGGRFPRLSWYLRLPGPIAHPLAGVVRCEVAADLTVADAVTRADLVSGLLPRYASQPHKDSRAPQNLYPIAGLEYELRHRLGDARLLELALRRASAPVP